MDANVLIAMTTGLGITGGLWALARWSGERHAKSGARSLGPGSRETLPSAARTASQAASGSEAGNPPDPPVRRAPPHLPRMVPGALPATPSIPASYVGGSVFIPAGNEAWSLLALIQQQLSPNCPGTAMQVALDADPDNSDPILVGAASTLGGPLTIDNYAYELRPSSPTRIYRSGFPGSTAPVGELQVLYHTAIAGPPGGYLHVEVQS